MVKGGKRGRHLQEEMEGRMGAKWKAVPEMLGGTVPTNEEKSGATSSGEQEGQRDKIGLWISGWNPAHLFF